MKPSDYIFNVGDEIIDIDGVKGTITQICKCNRCEQRGFYELEWVDEYDDSHYITNHTAERGFVDYHKIGNYHFNRVRRYFVEEQIELHETELARLRKQLRLIEELEKVEEE